MMRCWCTGKKIKRPVGCVALRIMKGRYIDMYNLRVNMRDAALVIKRAKGVSP